MRLVLFDVDGTLTATSRVDNRCFARAFERTFRRPIPTTDWNAYKHVSDVGILKELLEDDPSVRLSEGDIAAFERVYKRELETAFILEPAAFRSVPGARGMLRHVAESVDTVAALATGGMRQTALFKLSRIGIEGASMIGAFANDAVSRTDIARMAIERSGVSPDDIVYVGDGLWDLRTAAEMGIRFIGIAYESSPEHLSSAGATIILSDYENARAVSEALETATVPPVVLGNTV